MHSATLYQCLQDLKRALGLSRTMPVKDVERIDYHGRIVEGKRYRERTVELRGTALHAVPNELDQTLEAERTSRVLTTAAMQLVCMKLELAKTLQSEPNCVTGGECSGV